MERDEIKVCWEKLGWGVFEKVNGCGNDRWGWVGVTERGTNGDGGLQGAVVIGILLGYGMRGNGSGDRVEWKEGRRVVPWERTERKRMQQS